MTDEEEMAEWAERIKRMGIEKARPQECCSCGKPVDHDCGPDICRQCIVDWFARAKVDLPRDTTMDCGDLAIKEGGQESD